MVRESDRERKNIVNSVFYNYLSEAVHFKGGCGFLEWNGYVGQTCGLNNETSSTIHQEPRFVIYTCCNC